MNRRSLVALPAGIAAFAASRALAQAQATAPAAPHVSRKAMLKQSGTKAAYKIPKNPAKQAKYLSSLTALLSLNAAQQAMATAILTNAAVTQASVKASLKAARKALPGAVAANDSGAIAQISNTLGALTEQYVSNGAAANAALFQMLTPDQQTKLSLFQG